MITHKNIKRTKREHNRGAKEDEKNGVNDRISEWIARLFPFSDSDSHAGDVIFLPFVTFIMLSFSLAVLWFSLKGQITFQL